MSNLPETVMVGDAEFVRVDAPEGIACWTASLDRGTDGIVVSLLIEPEVAPPDAALQIAEKVVANAEELVATAAGFLSEQLRAPGYALSEGELELLGRDAAPFEAPDIVVWADGTWMLRFAESPLRMADPYGIAVAFEGLAPRSVEDLSDAASADEPA